MEIKTVLIISHLIGVVIGAGGAFAADYIFFQSVKDGRINETEMRFIRNSSKMVWVGLLILVLSGLGLFLEDTTKYLASSKFITKMIIVLIIAINGVFFHLTHLPRLQKCLNTDLKNNKFFSTKKDLFLFSGVVSTVSWVSAIILGSLRSIPYTIGLAISIYTGIILVSFVVAKMFTKKYF